MYLSHTAGIGMHTVVTEGWQLSVTSTGASAAYSYSECSVTEERLFLLQNRKDEQMIKRRNMPQMSDEAPVSSSIGVKAYDAAYISQLAEVRQGPQGHSAKPSSTVYSACT